MRAERTMEKRMVRVMEYIRGTEAVWWIVEI
jgi:hypothetical protein